jgi:hypothetical protein
VVIDEGVLNGEGEEGGGEDKMMRRLNARVMQGVWVWVLRDSAISDRGFTLSVHLTRTQKRWSVTRLRERGQIEGAKLYMQPRDIKPARLASRRRRGERIE